MLHAWRGEPSVSLSEDSIRYGDYTHHLSDDERKQLQPYLNRSNRFSGEARSQLIQLIKDMVIPAKTRKELSRFLAENMEQISQREQALLKLFARNADNLSEREQELVEYIVRKLKKRI